MSFRNQLHHVAFRGCLIIGVLLSASALGQSDGPISDDASRQSQAQQQQPNAAGVPPPTEQKKIAPGEYRTVCEQPQERETADLCQQWRMAEAAREQVDWVRQQFFATIAEVIFLVGAVFFSGWAAFAASRAAKTAQGSVKLAREGMQLELRPYLSIREFVIDRTFGAGNSRGFWIEPSIVNFGHTPARITKSIVAARLVSGGSVDRINWNDNTEELETGSEIEILAAPTVPLRLFKKTFSLEYAELLANGGSRLFYRYYIEYRGPFEQVQPYKMALVGEVTVEGSPGQLFDNHSIPVNSLIRVAVVSKGSVST